VTLVGCIAFAGAGAWWYSHAGAGHDFAVDLLPGLVLSGIGVALTQTTLYGVIAIVLPPHRFATGSGVLNMARQIAIALGVAMLIAVIGSTDRLDAFRTAFALIAAVELAAAAIAVALPRTPTAPRASTSPSAGPGRADHADLPHRRRPSPTVAKRCPSRDPKLANDTRRSVSAEPSPERSATASSLSSLCSTSPRARIPTTPPRRSRRETDAAPLKAERWLSAESR